MRSRSVSSAGLALALVGWSGCAKRADERHFVLQGQVIAITPNHQEATIKHEEIAGLMPAMTMPYKVRDSKLLNGLGPGDLINATLAVVTNDAYLIDVKRVGRAPLEQPPAEAPLASHRFELLNPGEAVPDTRFVDQEGRPHDFRSFQGTVVLLTFIYTRCPMPTFCPLLDRHFATIQRRLRDDVALNGHVHLVTVSFDPAADTPSVLKAHARTLDADSRTWTFLTGVPDDIDQFAARFGVSIARARNDQRDITHNLRTAIIDARGTLVKQYTGNEWTPEQMLADLRLVVAAP